MNYKEQRTKLGNFMYNSTDKLGSFLTDHMYLYYILNYTWGLLTTIIGWTVLGFIKLFLRKKVVEFGKFGPCHYIMLGNNWGGLEIGINFLLADNMGKNWTLHTKQHEMGHTFQNAIYGPFAIFLIFIPSLIRYWLNKAGKIKKDYDSIWFEGSASDLGEKYYKRIGSN